MARTKGARDRRKRRKRAALLIGTAALGGAALHTPLKAYIKMGLNPKNKYADSFARKLALGAGAISLTGTVASDQVLAATIKDREFTAKRRSNAILGNTRLAGLAGGATLGYKGGMKLRRSGANLNTLLATSALGGIGGVIAGDRLGKKLKRWGTS